MKMDTEGEENKVDMNRANHVFTNTDLSIKFDEKFNAKNVKREDVKGVPEAFLIHNVLTPKEAKQFIDLTNEMGYYDAPISTGFGKGVMVKDMRDNTRVMWEVKEDIWKKLYERTLPFLPSKLNDKPDWNICGLNERFRFYRYDHKQRFTKHYDGCFPRSDVEMSHLTMIVYLNEGFEGGHTTFYTDDEETIAVAPKTGSALCFRHTGRHSPLHEGSPNLSKDIYKYVLRSDVMYKRQTGVARWFSKIF